MKTLIKTVAMLAVVAGSALVAQAQTDHSAHSSAGAYPDVCKSDIAAMPPMAHGGMAMQDHQKAAMEGMQKMDADMMQGMMKDDADVAFVCGMIAHHQGAIDMANVELKYGDNAWAKEMAQRVIDAQTKEIADMTAWLKDNAK